MPVRSDQIRDREHTKCAVDGTRGAHAHHRWLVKQGGPDTWPNMIWLCQRCHDWCHLVDRPGAERLGLILPAHPQPEPWQVRVPYFDPPDAGRPSWARLTTEGNVKALAPGPRPYSYTLTPADWLAVL